MLEYEEDRTLISHLNGAITIQSCELFWGSTEMSDPYRPFSIPTCDLNFPSFNDFGNSYRLMWDLDGLIVFFFNFCWGGTMNIKRIIQYIRILHLGCSKFEENRTSISHFIWIIIIHSFENGNSIYFLWNFRWNIEIGRHEYLQ